MEITSGIPLNSGRSMPEFGFGTYLVPAGEETERAVGWALDSGYRLIDTASMYGNEKSVGEAVRRSRVPREEIFVTTKLWNADHGRRRALRAFDESCRRLDIGYVDLYLIHWPVERIRKETWQALEDIAAGGRCRAIGVSNYMVHHLEELLAESDVPPAVNQIQFHPFCFQDDVLDFCLERGVQIQAYCPLVRARRFDNPVLADIARSHRKTEAQVLLRWSIQHGAVPIPKSVHRDRIEENIRAVDFELSDDDMRALDSLDEAYYVGWDPTDTP